MLFQPLHSVLKGRQNNWGHGVLVPTKFCHNSSFDRNLNHGLRNDFFFFGSSDAASLPGIWEFSYPITTRGADYAHHITASTPGFETQQHI